MKISLNTFYLKSDCGDRGLGYFFSVLKKENIYFNEPTVLFTMFKFCDFERKVWFAKIVNMLWQNTLL